MIQKIQIQYVDEIRGLYTKFPDFAQPSLGILPNNGLGGYMVLKDDKVICACYNYIASNSPVAWLSWLVADRDYKDSDKHTLIFDMMEFMFKDLKSHGYQYLFSVAMDKHLEDICVKAGFDNSGPIGKELIKTL